ncbi:MAG: GTP-binding protein [Pseudomonadaceae bacterium]|nr:GTP-binding protein [Pseudomonadaceae bacterium]
MDIPITIVAGYLGAGKTTLINRVLNHAGDLSGLAILVNDFGDINIDATLVRENAEDDQVFELSNGCVCCTIQDDFSASLEALQKRSLKQVLFEASGVASPAKLRAQCTYPGFYPTRIFVLLDATQYARQKEDKYICHLVQQQTREADVLVITKGPIEAVSDTLESAAEICHVDDQNLFYDLLSTQQRAAPALTASEISTEFLTTTLAQNTPVPLEDLEQWLVKLPEWISRIKGFVLTDRGTRLIQGTGQYRELTEHDNAQTVSDIHQVVLITAQTHQADKLNALSASWPGK